MRTPRATLAGFGVLAGLALAAAGAGFVAPFALPAGLGAALALAAGLIVVDWTFSRSRRKALRGPPERGRTRWSGLAAWVAEARKTERIRREAEALRQTRNQNRRSRGGGCGRVAPRARGPRGAHRLGLPRASPRAI